MIRHNRATGPVVIFALVLGLWAVVVPAGPADGAGGDEGSASGIVLRMDPGARSSAFGSAYVARSNSALSMHFNPAGLGMQRYTQGMFTHFQLFAGIEYNHASMVTPIADNRAGIGLSLTSLDYGDLQRAEVANQNPQTAGLGQFGANDLTTSGSLGFSLTRRLKVGMTASYIRQQIAGFQASTTTGDFGLQYHIDPGDFVIGAASRNVGGQLKFVQEADPLPQVYDAGLYYSMRVRGRQDELNFAGDMVLPSDADSYLSAGVEYGFERTLYLRLGYNGAQESDDGFTIGAGIHDHRFKIHYSFVPMGDLGNHQRITMSYLFGDLDWRGPRPDVRQTPEPEQPEPEPRPELQGGNPRIRKDVGEQKSLLELLRDDSNLPRLKAPSNVSWSEFLRAGKDAYRDGDFPTARRFFLRVHTIRPGHVNNLLWLGTMEWYLGMDNQAISRMDRVLEMDPDNPIARENIKRMKSIMKQNGSNRRRPPDSTDGVE